MKMRSAQCKALQRTVDSALGGIRRSPNDTERVLKLVDYVVDGVELPQALRAFGYTGTYNNMGVLYLNTIEAMVERESELDDDQKGRLKKLVEYYMQ